MDRSGDSPSLFWSAQDRAQVFEILSAYVQTTSHRPPVGADLRGAHLAGARASADTSWPSGFDWRAAGARLVESC